MARVSNAPDCTAQGLRLGPRRDRVAKRPDSGRTTAWANVEGRHLLSGSVGRLQLRSPDLPRNASPRPARRPFLCPLPSVQNRWGTKAEKWYPAPQLVPLRSPWHHKKGPNRVGFGRGHHGPRPSARGPLHIGALACAMTPRVARCLFSRNSFVPPPCVGPSELRLGVR